MTVQPARHECHACCPLQAEKPGIQPVLGNTHGTHVEQVVSSFQKILRGSQLTWYYQYLTVIRLYFDVKFSYDSSFKINYLSSSLSLMCLTGNLSVIIHRILYNQATFGASS